MAHKTWVVVADGAHAKIFTAEAGAMADTPIHTFDTTQARPHELVSDKPGRAYQSMEGRTGGAGQKSDPRRHAEEVFIKEVAAHVEKAGKAGAFDRLVLVAAPRALGDLRRELSDITARKIVAEVNRDLVNHPVGEVRTHIADALRGS